MAWHGMAWHGIAWHGTARHGTTRYGTVRYGTLVWYIMVRYGVVWDDIVRIIRKESMFCTRASFLPPVSPSRTTPLRGVSNPFVVAAIASSCMSDARKKRPEDSHGLGKLQKEIDTFTIEVRWRVGKQVAFILWEAHTLVGRFEKLGLMYCAYSHQIVCCGKFYHGVQSS